MTLQYGQRIRSIVRITVIEGDAGRTGRQRARLQAFDRFKQWQRIEYSLQLRQLRIEHRIGHFILKQRVLSSKPGGISK